VDSARTSRESAGSAFWAIVLSAFGLGTLAYTLVVSPGYYVQRRNVPFVAMIRWFLVARCSGDRSALRDCLTARRRRYDATVRTLTVVLITIGDDSGSSDDIRLEYPSTEDGTKACQTACGFDNG
jgi:hypothetical protein